MRQHAFTLPRDDLARLAALVGGSWLYVAGETLTHHLNTPVDVIVGTTSGSVSIVSAIAEADFEGEAETYAVLSVTGNVSGFAEAKRKGNVYVHHQREAVKDIRIVRDTVTEVSDGETTWRYVTDVGVVFDLTGGAVAVVKASHHTEMLFVRMGNSAGELDIPDRVIEWDNDLVVQHHSSRQFIPVEDLIG